MDFSATVSLLDLTLYEKAAYVAAFLARPTRASRSRGCSRKYMKGKVDLDSLITQEYKLEEINQGYQDMRDGKNLRGAHPLLTSERRCA